jgi:hypothetical protein
VTSRKGEAAVIQREEESTVALTFPKVKAEEEVSCTSLCPL